MNCFHIVITPDAEADLNRFFMYILLNLRNSQAAFSFLDDYDLTLETLSRHAGIIRDSDNPVLRARNLKRINFQKHRYFLLFSVKEETVTVYAVGHFLQDIQNVLH